MTRGGMRGGMRVEMMVVGDGMEWNVFRLSFIHHQKSKMSYPFCTEALYYSDSAAD